MNKCFCDKCGNELPPGTKKNVTVGVLIRHMGDDGEESYTRNHVFRYDLCNDCACAVAEFITGFKECEKVRF